MRINEPVTQREFVLEADATLMSTTDLQGNITYVNEAFVQVSGFSREELLGQPHNLVRHPDMPREAFADMWNTLRQGRAWSALVKNRRKNGDHYWVRANATPVYRRGQLAGYMSVRTTPLRAEVEAAESLYRRFREGRAQGLRFCQGLVMRGGGLAWMSWGRRMPLAWRLRLALMVVFVAGCAGWLVTGASWPVALGGIGIQLGLLLLMMGRLQVQVVRPLALVLGEAEHVASGQTPSPDELGRVDEIGRLQRALHQAGLNLKALLDDVQVRATQVADASSEIATGNDDLSARTEQAAANLQKTAASMEQFSTSIQQNAESAVRAARQASLASTATQRGGEAVRQVVSTMQNINQSSQRMTDIIGVIDGLAFQTNILALNAAVEAARAGEQGRGFAVVAGEVRSLAQRSATAAHEIRELIAQGRSGAEAGVALVSSAGQMIADSQRQVVDVSTLIDGIGTVTTEQAGAVSQVSESVNLLDQMTQQNAAMVEQIAAAARGLQHEATRLREAIGAFS
ncbi:MAG TPA: hypothetical protein DCY64_13540 [Hydrogenophaga sp.]|nr:PAS domain-containing methyl-accepting chemotaxis protein [Hydrogenophaga sp.]OGA78732.1 MAG: aerotaxis receptor Aer [Burkholderiales bacterium GWE1_65_30]OGA89304.1 MAG: aerotaxis receptor Aer [Burkholderiales bacterium GWF1_66_17]HAX21283.1 hypothetical protein [Hydrogenophaga sp.]HBU17119.1 hypothetical protein [Hydrogenophaga sp.]